MRWIVERLRQERGATAVMVAVLMVPLIGFLAIALDVGALYAERGQLQNGADAAALAVARDCAVDGCGDASADAAEFASANANDGAANVLAPAIDLVNQTVTVSASTLTDTGEDAINHPFASLIGATSTTVGATATAEWGAPKAATVLPLAISLCEFQPALDGTLVLIQYDKNQPCPDLQLPGGFGWLDRIDGECEAAIDLDEASAPSEPGNSYPSACDEVLTNLEGETILVPIFDGAYNPSGTEITQGQAASFHIYAFAAFTITGWKLSGGNSFPTVNIDPAAPNCSGNCRGIQGYFDHWVSTDAATEIGGPDLGAAVVRLID